MDRLLIHVAMVCLCVLFVRRIVLYETFPFIVISPASHSVEFCLIPIIVSGEFPPSG